MLGLGAAVFLLGASISLVIWALNSAEGTRALFKTVSFFSAVQIDAKEIQGRLRDELKLQGVRIRWPQGEIRADRLHLRWQPAELWNHKVILDELSLEGVLFQDRGSETKKNPFSGWPAAPFWLSKTQGRIDSLRIQGLAYQRRDEDAVPLGHLSARGQWDGNLLEISDFRLSGPPVQAEGTMKVAFARPSLNLDLKASFAEEYAGMDSLSVKLLLGAPAKPEEASGTIWVLGQKQNTESLRLEGEVGLTTAALSWRNLRVSLPGRKGTLQGEGSWSFAVRPSLQGRVSFSEVNLTPELGIATDLSGHVEIKGPLDGYRGQIRIANKVKGWPEGKISGEFQGDLQGVKFTKLDAGWLDGTVQGSLGFSWAHGLAVEGRLQGAKLNPGRFHSEWEGILNLKLEGRILSRQDRLSEAVVKAHFSESLLRGHLFTGELDAGMEKDLWKIGQFRMQGQGFILEAQGILQEKVHLEARFTDLSKVMRDVEGQLLATGWLRYRENQLTGALHGQGNNLSGGEIRAGSFTADLRLKESAADGQPAFEMETRLENLQIGSFPISALSLETSGVLKAHTAKLALYLDGREVQGELEGGYENGLWKGSLARMTGKDAQVLWSLLTPAKIQLSAKEFRLGPLSVKSTRGERIQADADLALDPVSGSLRVEWGSLDLTRLDPWLRGGKLSGQSTGSLSARWQKSGMQIMGNLNMKGAFSRDPIKLEAISGQAQCAWNEQGLRTTLALDLGQGGNLEVRMTSAEPVQTGPPQSGKINAKWKGLGHALLSPLFPPKLLLRGQSSGQVSGQWFPDGQVEAAGEVKVSRTEVVWQEEEKPLAVTLQKADLDFTWRGESLRGGVSLSFADHGLLKGNFQLPLAARLNPSFHSGGPLALAVKGQLQEKGFFAARYPEMITKSRGNIDLDFNAEGTWNQPRFKGALRIADTEIQFSPGRGKLQVGDGPDPLHLEVSSGSAALEWGDKGLWSSWVLKFRKHGTVEGKIVSSESAHLSLPKAGQMEMTWTALDIALLQPLGPKELSLEGMAAGQMKGNWLPEGRLEAKGDLKLAQGKLSWRTENGLISAGIPQGDLDFSWREEGLQGNLSLSLETYGSLQGNFRLPLPARFPLQFDPARPFRAALRGQARENGLLSAIFPGTVQESGGKVDLDLQVDGTWKKPILQGALQFANGGAFLPGLGIRVEDLSMRCRLHDERIQIEAFQARSGPGQIEGNGTIWLKNWEVRALRGKNLGGQIPDPLFAGFAYSKQPQARFSRGPPHSLRKRGSPASRSSHSGGGRSGNGPAQLGRGHHRSAG